MIGKANKFNRNVPMSTDWIILPLKESIHFESEKNMLIGLTILTNGLEILEYYFLYHVYI